ncbi:MAG: hypothetical protein U1E51_20345 [Candidatus Binatia bacterium]|nr:hypothetical protein [Candidatus Binatia bacterium]
MAKVKVKEVESEKTMTCVWTGFNDDYNDYWETSCGQSFILDEGTPKQNHLKFCYNCGKPLEQKVKV